MVQVSSYTVDAALLERIDAVPALAARTDVSDLSGGLTNRNLKVTTPEGVYVARLSSPESALLAIDRVNEHANSRAAAASGAAPRVIAFAPEVSVLVVDFIEATHLGQRRRPAPGERAPPGRRLPAAARRARAS